MKNAIKPKSNDKTIADNDILGKYNIRFIIASAVNVPRTNIKRDTASNMIEYKANWPYVCMFTGNNEATGEYWNVKLTLS